MPKARELAHLSFENFSETSSLDYWTSSMSFKGFLVKF